MSVASSGNTFEKRDFSTMHIMTPVTLEQNEEPALHVRPFSDEKRPLMLGSSFAALKDDGCSLEKNDAG